MKVWGFLVEFHFYFYLIRKVNLLLIFDSVWNEGEFRHWRKDRDKDGKKRERANE